MAPRLRMAGGIESHSRRGSAAIVVMLTTILSAAHGERPQAVLLSENVDGALRSLLESTFGADDVAWGNLYTSDAKLADTLGSSSKP